VYGHSGSIPMYRESMARTASPILGGFDLLSFFFCSKWEGGVGGLLYDFFFFFACCISHSSHGFSTFLLFLAFMP